jgi:hypothetical protein
MAERLASDPSENQLKLLDTAVSILQILPFPVDLWKIQNSYYRLLEGLYPRMQRQKELGDQTAQAWLGAFEALGQKLAVKVR